MAKHTNLSPLAINERIAAGGTFTDQEVREALEQNGYVSVGMLLAHNQPDDDGPGEEDGPWAEGWEQRCGGTHG